MLDWIKVAGKLVYDRPTRERLLGYRPVVMCLVRSTTREAYLFVQPTANPKAWMPPQEGIAPHATVEQAAIDCLAVELGIPRNQLHFRRSVWLGRKAIPERKGSRNVEYSLRPMQGKSYYAALILVDEGCQVVRNPAEVAGHEWLTRDEVRSRLVNNSARKIELLEKLFGLLTDSPL